jgi:hypothetical protein
MADRSVDVHFEPRRHFAQARRKSVLGDKGPYDLDGLLLAARELLHGSGLL